MAGHVALAAVARHVHLAVCARRPQWLAYSADPAVPADEAFCRSADGRGVARRWQGAAPSIDERMRSCVWLLACPPPIRLPRITGCVLAGP